MRRRKLLGLLLSGLIPSATRSTENYSVSKDNGCRYDRLLGNVKISSEIVRIHNISKNSYELSREYRYRVDSIWRRVQGEASGLTLTRPSGTRITYRAFIGELLWSTKNSEKFSIGVWFAINNAVANGSTFYPGIYDQDKEDELLDFLASADKDQPINKAFPFPGKNTPPFTFSIRSTGELLGQFSGRTTDPALLHFEISVPMSEIENIEKGGLSIDADWGGDFSHAQVSAKEAVRYFRMASDSLQKMEKKYDDKDCTVEVSGKPTKCLVTTVACEEIGLDDNCFELSMLRKLRDKWLRSTKAGLREIEIYQKMAPKIIYSISPCKSDSIELVNLYFFYILPSAIFEFVGLHFFSYRLIRHGIYSLALRKLGHSNINELTLNSK
jgi:hypothetical protein